jgi:hypothetical protein
MFGNLRVATLLILVLACEQQAPLVFDDGEFRQNGPTIDRDKEDKPRTPDRIEAGDAGDAANVVPGAEDASTTPDPADPSFAACTAKGGEQCSDCCAQMFPQAMDQLFAAIERCECVTPGTCKVACAGNYCAGGPPSLACELCLNVQGPSCSASGEGECRGQASCAPFLRCDDSCR